MAKGKEIHQLVGALVDAGFDVRRTKKGRYVVNKEGVHVGVVSPTACDFRAIKNFEAALKRAGRDA